MASKIIVRALMILMVWLPMLTNAQAVAHRPHYLRGKVYHQKTGGILSDVSMKISNGHATTTDSEGYFALNLDVGEKFMPGTSLTIYLMDPSLGNDMVEVVVPSDLSRDVRLEFKSDRYQVVSGIVLDKATAASLAGITVRAVPEVQGLKVKPPPAVMTDGTGWFWISLDREMYGKVDYVTLTAKDMEGRRYVDWVNLQQARTGIQIQLEPILHDWTTGGTTSATGMDRPSQNLRSGTLCVKNNTGKLVEASIMLKLGGAYDPSVQRELKIGPDEEPCFENLPAGDYGIRISLPGARWGEYESYSTEVVGGSTQNLLIR